MKQSAIVFIASMAVSSGALAQRIGPPQNGAESGREWLARCGPSIKSGDPKGLEAMMSGVACLGSVSGFIDLNTTYRELDLERGVLFEF